MALDVKIDGWAWLRRDQLGAHQLTRLRKELTLHPDTYQDDAPPVVLYRETPTHFGIPRAYYSENKRRPNREHLAVSDGDPMSRDIRSRMTFEGRFAEQESAIDRFLLQFKRHDYGGWILQADTGWGKTNAALELAYRHGRRTLIVVGKNFFYRQWRDRIEECFDNPRIGRIQQDECTYRGMDFVIGMLDSLVNADKYPPEIFDAFGMVLVDEVHRIGAQTWAEVAPKFNARYRVGVTATPRRKDGAEDVFRWHIGPILYHAKVPAEPFDLRILETSAEIEPQPQAVKRGRKWYTEMVHPNDLSWPKFLKALTEHDLRNLQIAEDIALAALRGRKVMVVGDRLDHLRAVWKLLERTLDQHANERDELPRSDFYTGQWYVHGTDEREKRTDEQLDRAKSANVLFATRQMVAEGFDLPALDVLYLLTPMSDIEQVVGRIRRQCLPKEPKCSALCPWRAGECKRKPTPIMVDVVDPLIRRSMKKWRRRLSFYRENDVDIPGEK